jgi:hypothetical protein
MRASFQGCLCGILFEGRTLQSFLKTGVVMSVRSRKSITNMAAWRKGFVVSDIQVQRSAEPNQAAPEERRKKMAGAPFWLGMRYISMRDG